MKKRLLALAMGLLALGMTTGVSGSSDAGSHKIGVLVYDIADEEVMAFREYLQEYVAPTFGDVQFQYSDSIMSEEEALDFIDRAGSDGVEGILSFLSYDLEAEVDACEESGMYYMIASGTVPEDQLEAVKKNPWFLGVAGPGAEMEQQAVEEMTLRFGTMADRSNSYFIMSGGAPYGNEMHRLRTVSVLDTIEEAYGLVFETTPEEMALSAEPLSFQKGALTVTVVPGYANDPSAFETMKSAFDQGVFDTVISVQPLHDMADVIGRLGCRTGIVDCYSIRNLQLFTDGRLDYVVGKYGSMIGPSFALMYNALTGYAEDFRVNGEALEINQCFWSSDNLDDYTEKYTLAASMEMNAYNYEDLFSMCKAYNPDATPESLIKLAGECSYEDVLARRGAA